MKILYSTVFALVLFSTSELSAKEMAFTLKSSDGFALPAKVATPNKGKVKKVIVLIHGSGPQSMDVAVPGTNKSIFKPVSDALVKRGFAVIRYDKRAYVWNRRITKDSREAKSKEFAAFMGDPYGFFIKDAKAALAYGKKRFKGASLYFLGHSQGTFVALQAAHKNPDVTGVALWGFYGINIGALTFVQSVYRNLHYFTVLDSNKDGALTAEEMRKGSPGIAAMAPGLPALDRDKDGKLSFQEIQAVLFSNLAVTGMAHRFIRQEEKYVPAFVILKDAPFKVAFFQGENDNQTPVFHTHSAQILFEHVWHRPKSQFLFRYFPGLGHGLDPRADFYDMNMNAPDPGALKKVASDLASFF